jgi:uncharacterized membrane protein HdeD (DUF308 family)
MACARTLRRVEQLAWVLIYGGLFAILAGFVLHGVEDASGWPLFLAGTFAAVAGIALILVRSRLDESA